MSDVDPIPSGSPPEPSGLRVALTGCGALLFAVGGLVALILWLVAELTGGGGAAAGGGGPAAVEELRSWDEVENDADVEQRAREQRAGGRLTRTERRRLTAELEEIERELDFARGQLRAAFGADAKQGWQQRIDGLRADRDRIRGRLDR